MTSIIAIFALAMFVLLVVAAFRSMPTMVTLLPVSLVIGSLMVLALRATQDVNLIIDAISPAL